MEAYMEQNSRNHEEVEIDLGQYIKMIVKRKMTFIAVFVLTLAIGFVYILFSPKIYRALMMIQPPVIGQSMTGKDDIVSAEELKGLIVNNAFRAEIANKMNMDFQEIPSQFRVTIPRSTNILQISIDLESQNKELGVTLLQNLREVIFNNYARHIEAERANINNRIKSNEREIVKADEKINNLQQQIKEAIVRRDKLLDEIDIVKKNTEQILEKREGLTDLNMTDGVTKNASILLLSNFIQNNTSYINQLNNQFSELTIRGLNLNTELKNITSKISDFQMEIDILKIRNCFVANLKTISEPWLFENPVSPNRRKLLGLSIIMGLVFGLMAVFLHEFWANNLVKK